MARTLGIDLGTRRIGVAMSDDKGKVATPFTVLQRTSDDNDCRVIADIATAEHIKTIVLGYPLSMDGSVGSAAAVAESFAKKLKEHGVRVKLWDERLTTAEAERSLKHTGMKGRARRAVVDKVAASVILQSYLDVQHAKKR